MAYNEAEVLGLVKMRLNRTTQNAQMDEYLKTRIKAAAVELEKKGISLSETSAADTMLLVDLTVWQYQSRDKQSGEPEWLRTKIRERWLHDDP